MSDFLAWVQSNGVNLTGLITAAASVVVSIAQWYVQKRHEQQKLRVSRESDFIKALQSDSLETLGTYLDSVVGAFRVAEYVDNAQVRTRVDTYLARIQSFVGTTEQIQASAPATAESSYIPPSDLPAGTAVLLEQVAAGDIWNALAKLRRHIEVELREFARTNEVLLPERIGPNRLLDLLMKAGLVSPGDAGALRFAITVASRAIHGEDVDAATAEAAIIEGGTGLSRALAQRDSTTGA